MAAGGGRHEHSKLACSSRWLRTLLCPQTGATLPLLCAAQCCGCSCSNLAPLRRPSLGVGLEQVAQALLHLVHDLQEGRVPAAGHTTSSRPAGQPSVARCRHAACAPSCLAATQAECNAQQRAIHGSGCWPAVGRNAETGSRCDAGGTLSPPTHMWPSSGSDCAFRMRGSALAGPGPIRKRWGTCGRQQSGRARRAEEGA